MTAITVSRDRGEHDGDVVIEARRTRWPYRKVTVRLTPDHAIALGRAILQAAGAHPAEAGTPVADDWEALCALVLAAADRDLAGCTAILRGTQPRRLQLLTAATKMLVYTVASDMTPEQFRHTAQVVRHAR